MLLCTGTIYNLGLSAFLIVFCTFLHGNYVLISVYDDYHYKSKVKSYSITEHTRNYVVMSFSNIHILSGKKKQTSFLIYALKDYNMQFFPIKNCQLLRKRLGNDIHQNAFERENRKICALIEIKCIYNIRL